MASSKLSKENGYIDTEHRAPTVHGTLSHCPKTSIQRVAEKSNVPVSALATLVVKYTSSKLYTAILEYAAMSTPPEEGIYNPLMIDSLDQTVDDSDDDDISDFAANAARFSRVARRVGHKVGSDTLTSGLGLRKKRIPVPNFKFSLGETAVVWPPPQHLTAQALLTEQEQSRKRRKLNSSKPSPEIPAEKMDNMDVTNETEQASAAGEAGPKETNTIHLIHYSVGEPRAGDMGLSTYREIMLVSTIGPEVLRNFTKEIIIWYFDKNQTKQTGSRFSLYRFKMDRCGSGWWQLEGRKHARPPSSVILPNGQMDSILKDISNFIKPETKKWYRTHGLQHRRAYLFFGPPGTGKTSTIRTIASEFGLNCCFLGMTNSNFSNQVLGDALNQIPANALIVLEDVDALFNEDRKNEQGASLTFSGLLNALDGLISADGVITVMTTNHIDRLDKALIRSGRVDRRFSFGRATNSQISDLFRSFYPHASNSTADKFLDAVVKHPETDEARSIATLQQLFIDQRESSAEECAESVDKFFESHFPDGSIKKKTDLYT